MIDIYTDNTRLARQQMFGLQIRVRKYTQAVPISHRIFHHHLFLVFADHVFWTNQRIGQWSGSVHTR
jgi:hypothetical protein